MQGLAMPSHHNATPSRSLRDELCTVATRSALLTRPEAAQVLGISLRATDALIASGDLPVVRFGATVRVRPSAIEYLIEARESRNKPRRAGARRNK